MRLEHFSQDKLEAEISAIVGRYLDLGRFRLYFFGSRVAGGGSDRSDVDIAIDGPARVPLATLGKIREEIEDLPTLYTVEIVDFQAVSPEFLGVARNSLEPFRTHA